MFYVRGSMFGSRLDHNLGLRVVQRRICGICLASFFPSASATNLIVVRPRLKSKIEKYAGTIQAKERRPKRPIPKLRRINGTVTAPPATRA